SFRRDSIDGDRHAPNAVLNHSLQDVSRRMVEVYAVIRVNHDLAFKCDAKQFGEPGIEKHLSVIGKLHFGEFGIRVEQRFEGGGIQMTCAHGCSRSAAGGGAARTRQLTVRRSVDLDHPGGRQALHSFLLYVLRPKSSLGPAKNSK